MRSQIESLVFGATEVEFVTAEQYKDAVQDKVDEIMELIES